MKTLKSIAILATATIFLASCQTGAEKQESKEEITVKTPGAKQSHGYQLKLADNSMTYPFSQKELGYGYDALEPYIDQATMELHYSKHHAGYTSKFNTAVEENNLNGMKLFNIFDRMSKYPAAVRNNGGGFYNHLLFWEILAPNAGGAPSGELAEAIAGEFGSLDDFKSKFNDAAKTVFGSGWAWLSVSAEGKLFISKTSNQDNPLMDVVDQRGIPILALDVWEHAYYLKYQNKRPEYVTNFWNLVNWKEVERRYAEAVSMLK